MGNECFVRVPATHPPAVGSTRPPQVSTISSNETGTDAYDLALSLSPVSKFVDMINKFESGPSAADASPAAPPPRCPHSLLRTPRGAATHHRCRRLWAASTARCRAQRRRHTRARRCPAGLSTADGALGKVQDWITAFVAFTDKFTAVNAALAKKALTADSLQDFASALAAPVVEAPTDGSGNAKEPDKAHCEKDPTKVRSLRLYASPPCASPSPFASRVRLSQDGQAHLADTRRRPPPDPRTLRRRSAQRTKTARRATRASPAGRRPAA